MESPDDSNPPDDPLKKEPGWKDITNRCEPIAKKLLAQATDLFGSPTVDPIGIRITELKSGPRTDFFNGITYIRVGIGVAGDERELEAQIAHEIVHAVSKPPQNATTVLEEGIASYFAVKFGRAYEPHAGDQQRYQDAYMAVTELLEKCHTVIKELRKPPRSIDKITAEEILKLCPKCPGELAKKLVNKF